MDLSIRPVCLKLPLHCGDIAGFDLGCGPSLVPWNVDDVGVLPLLGRNRPVQIRSFTIADEEAVIGLWRRCGLLRPWNDPKKDIQRKLKVRPDLFLVGHIDEQIVATAMIGYDGHRGWVNYLAVSPDQQRQGLGRQIMDAAERRLRECGAAKINLQVRTGNHEVIKFYRSIGFEMDDVVSMGKRLEQD